MTTFKKMRNLFLIILLFSIQAKAQSCDSLDNVTFTRNVPVRILESLVDSNCDKAKFYYAYELLVGYRIKKDSIRAIELLNECKEISVDCKYELFKAYYENDLEKAYQLICEIALLDPMINHRDSIMVANARLIAADMVERHLGNNEELSKSATWCLLYYEIEVALDSSPLDHMIGEVHRVLKMLTKKQLDDAYDEAEELLGRKLMFQRKMIKY